LKERIKELLVELNECDQYQIRFNNFDDDTIAELKAVNTYPLNLKMFKTIWFNYGPDFRIARTLVRKLEN
jgi:hypothetical protein